MKNRITFSPRASLAMTGMCIQQMGIWQMIGQRLIIRQKVIHHSPLEKLQDAFINIMAGGQGVVEVNSRVKPDEGMWRAFGRKRCADQSTVSDTLNACNQENVQQMQAAMKAVYQRFGAGYRHDYGHQWQLLDVDMSGMPAGRQGEGVEKGYFAQQKTRRGRQLGRVVASLYDEVVLDRLYPGKRQLDRCLQELVTEGEKVLALNPGNRRRTIIRVDAGGGRDADINWLLNRHYLVLVKVKHGGRSAKLCRSVTQWYQDPKVPLRQVGWVESPHAYEQPSRQLGLRHRKKNGQWSYHVLVFNLTDAMLLWLTGQPLPDEPSPDALLFTALDAYDRRGGGAETTIRGSKQGLGITKRNKKRFAAQEMLLLLGQLAYNLISWTRDGLAACMARLRHFGMFRMVRDAFHISGKLTFDERGHIIQITLNQAHHLASSFVHAFAQFLARDGTVAILDEI